MKSIIALTLLAVCTILNVVAYLPQIIQLIKTKSADDINLSSWIVWIASSLCYIGYIILETPEIGILSMEFFLLFMMIIITCLSAYYQKRKKRKRK